MEVPAWMDWVVVGFAIAILVGSGLVMSNGAIKAEKELNSKANKK